jgi:hypothetical protein
LNIEQLYHQYIKTISVAEQLELISLISKKLIKDSKPENMKIRSLLDLEGLGYEIWKGVDVQKYIDDLRNEWEHRL